MKEYVDIAPQFSDFLWAIEPEDLVNAEVTNTPLKQLFANGLVHKMEFSRVDGEIAQINELLGGGGLLTESLIQTVLNLQDELTETKSRLELLELMYNTDVSGNPFSVTFPHINDVNLTGIWDATARRIEF